MITTLTYASRAANNITREDIKNILSESRRYNAEQEITGMLCHGNQRFLHCIEGHREIINELYAKLIKDKRHEQLILIEYKTLPERLYSNWSMGYLSVFDEETMRIVSQRTSNSQFQPEFLIARQAATLIQSLKANLEPQFIVEPMGQIDSDNISRITSEESNQ